VEDLCPPLGVISFGLSLLVEGADALACRLNGDDIITEAVKIIITSIAIALL
jgi:hypothetical protein